MKSIILGFLLLFAISSCTSKNKSTIHGLWSLHIMEVRDTNTGQWDEWRQGMDGYLLYDNQDNVALHLTPKHYADTLVKYRNFTDTMSLQKMQHISMNYNYMGKYNLDKKNKIVSHLRLSHSNPNDWGVTVERRYYFSGDTLIITPVEKKNASLRLKWLKH